MAKVCDRCQRGPSVGNARSHSNIATKRRMMLNLHWHTIGGKRHFLCTSCLKTLNKKLKKTS